MSRVFTLRERIMLAVLAVLMVAALYYLLVALPTTETIRASQARLGELADLMRIEQAKAEQIAKMRGALEQIAPEQDWRAVMPVYDNFQKLLDELNNALGLAVSYKLNFQQPRFDGGVATRELQLVFYATHYNAAKSIIRALYSGPYKCDITSFKLAPSESDATDLTSMPVTATLSILYYEIYHEN